MRDYEVVPYKNKKYCVCRYKKRDGTNRLYVIDSNQLYNMLDESETWYEINGQIGCTKMVNGKSKCCYLHNLILPKRHRCHKIRHINGCKHDLRRCNLQTVDMSQINEYAQRDRKCKLPVTSGIKNEEIPKCVYYCKPQSGHGEMFIIEFKKDGKKYIWKSSSSRDVSLSDKLIEIKKKLIDISAQFPELMKDKNVLENISDKQVLLMEDFNNIIKSSNYRYTKDDLIKIPRKKVIRANVDATYRDTRKYLKTNTAIKCGRRHVNKLPSNSGILPASIPKYCYYQSANSKRGDAFIIDNHPYLPKGQRVWSTTTSRQIDTRTKFSDLLKKLRELKREYVNMRSGSKRNI